MDPLGSSTVTFLGALLAQNSVGLAFYSTAVTALVTNSTITHNGTGIGVSSNASSSGDNSLLFNFTDDGFFTSTIPMQ